MYTKDGPQKIAKVRYQLPLPSLSSSLTKLAGLLPRGRNVETLVTPKHRTLTRYHYCPPPAHFELDVWRRPAGIHREALRCRPT